MTTTDPFPAIEQYVQSNLDRYALPDLPEYRRLDHSRAWQAVGVRASGALETGTFTVLGLEWRRLLAQGEG